jgi:isopenicillin N synthase-like dioxygenase
MKNLPKIKYNPYITPEDLQERIKNLSTAIGEALDPLHALGDCGAERIADDEARYVTEMAGFLYLMKLVMEEEFTEAIKSVNRACWEIEVANKEGAVNVDHPWFGQLTGGIFETTTWSPEYHLEFDHLDHVPTPKEKEQMESGRKANKNHPYPAKPTTTDNSGFDDF